MLHHNHVFISLLASTFVQEDFEEFEQAFLYWLVFSPHLICPSIQSFISLLSSSSPANFARRCFTVPAWALSGKKLRLIVSTLNYQHFHVVRIISKSEQTRHSKLYKYSCLNVPAACRNMVELIYLSVCKRIPVCITIKSSHTSI